MSSKISIPNARFAYRANFMKNGQKEKTVLIREPKVFRRYSSAYFVSEQRLDENIVAINAVAQLRHHMYNNLNGIW